MEDKKNPRSIVANSRDLPDLDVDSRSIPDIDLDITKDNKEEVLSYLKSKYPSLENFEFKEGLKIDPLTFNGKAEGELYDANIIKSSIPDFPEGVVMKPVIKYDILDLKNKNEEDMELPNFGKKSVVDKKSNSINGKSPKQ